MLFSEEEERKQKPTHKDTELEIFSSKIQLKNTFCSQDDDLDTANFLDKTHLIEELSKKITRYQKSYYNEMPEITDEEFDALWDRLRVLDINNPIFSELGSDSSSFFDKREHLMPMGSLEKATDEFQFEEWISKHPSDMYIIQHKLDGASLELQYKKGELFAAVTRGDGKKGDNILINARNMQGVIKILDRPLDIAIRGEVIMSHEVHDQYFKDKSNCRNAANGLMKRKDGYKVELLHVLCYDMWFIEDDYICLELEKLKLLQELGFLIVPYEILSSLKDINQYRNYINEKRPSLDYDIDGLVVKLPLSEKSDMERLKPDGQIAYKFPLEYAQTKVLDIEWSESGHLYTPVAILEPVRIAGTIVKRANLVHINHIKDLGLGIGAEVLVVKRGEIIPKIEKVVVTPTNFHINIPNTCGTCNAILVNVGTRLYCPNLRCKRRLLFRTLRWCELLEIFFWGDSLLQRLVMEEEIINSVADMYSITKDILMAMDRIGEELATKLIKELHSKKEIIFEIFLAALGIDGVALLTAEKIVNAGYYNLDTLLDVFNQTKEDDGENKLSEIENIGPVIANNIKEFFCLFREEIIDLSKCVSIKEKDLKYMQLQSLYGLSFCFTGTLSISRKEAQMRVKELGGINKTSVTQDLSYLVCDNPSSNSTKIKNARAQGTTIISEQEFLDMIE